MKTEIKRREFVTKCFNAGAFGCLLFYGDSMYAQDEVKHITKRDLKTLTYCGFKCTLKCTLYRATSENNPELKKQAYEEFKMKEKYDLDFDADKVFCNGCKPEDKPLSINVKACAVRKCAIDKGYDCCIECSELTKCSQDLWTNFPQFKKQVIEMQTRYKS